MKKFYFDDFPSVKPESAFKLDSKVYALTPGTTISFYYNGKLRTVYVTNIELNTFTGIDKEANDFRCFKYNYQTFDAYYSKHFLEWKKDSVVVPPIAGLTDQERLAVAKLRFPNVRKWKLNHLNEYVEANEVTFQFDRGEFIVNKDGATELIFYPISQAATVRGKNATAKEFFQEVLKLLD